MRIAMGITLLVLASRGVAAPAAAESSRALTNWMAATSSFKKAGALVGQEKYSQAKAELSSGTTNLATPYKSLAAEFVTQLDSALKLSTNQADPRRHQALIDLCTDLRAYEAALKLQTADVKVTADELSDDAHYAWRLFNSGDGKAALAEYTRRVEREPVEYWQDYYKEQVRLLQQRPAAMTNVEIALQTTRQHYLKGLEANRDLFGALTELTRVLPYVKSAKEAIQVYQLIFKCLESLGDESGREAWQDKFLASYKSEPEVSAIVYVDRGQKAYLRKDLNASEAAFRKVCNEYATTSLYADGLYGLGLVLQAEQKYEAAVAEYTRIFTSNANEDLLDLESSEDYPNYRHKSAFRMSECYEATKDLKKALEYALMARDQYKYVSYCKDCMYKSWQNIENRVKDLEAAVKRAAPAAAP